MLFDSILLMVELFRLGSHFSQNLLQQSSCDILNFCCHFNNLKVSSPKVYSAFRNYLFGSFIRRNSLFVTVLP